MTTPGKQQVALLVLLLSLEDGGSSQRFGKLTKKNQQLDSHYAKKKTVESTGQLSVNKAHSHT